MGAKNARGTESTVDATEKETREEKKRERFDEESYRNVIPVTRSFSVPPPCGLYCIFRVLVSCIAFNARLTKRSRAEGAGRNEDNKRVGYAPLQRSRTSLHFSLKMEAVVVPSFRHR